MSSVLVFVFDGLQPAQVNPRLMPNLSAFAAGGVTFANHHSVFPTVTRVNASSMVTGMNPGEHGLTGNRLVIRDFDPDKHMGALEPELSRVAKAGLPVLLAPTLGQVLARHGKEYVAIGVGTSGNAYLHNPTAEDSGGATIHPTFALPRDLHESLIDRFGPWPDEAQPNTSRLAHAMRIMTEYVLPERMPGAALIWSSEPDKSHHSAGVGSSLGDTAIKEADGQFGDLMQCLRETGRAEDTDVFVVSDHGYSTISEIVPVEALVKEAGFPSGGGPGGVIVAQNGGAVLFYTMPGDMGTAQCLAAWLMAQPWCGTVTASEVVSGIPGTLPASLVGIEGPRAPELTMSFRWESTANEAGYHGMAYSTDGKPGTGQHGSMSRHEMHNILFASGPSFRSGLKLETPSGNLDLTPTILKVLSISGHEGMHGRVLEEALVGGPDAADVEWSTELHSAEHNLGEQVYRQQIKISTVGTTSYVDEGNRVD
ncbi:MAG TPA: alkaline phosphatase family protein [Dehalococcoidia bacterium]|nr:alkaline phosphatase family protein [Dehalococcoidia bacterium]